MENINLHNYQAYLLDYAEGNLSEDQQAELFAFLELHPGLEAELEDLDLPTLNEFELLQDEFDAKPGLKKNAEQWEDYRLIASLENLLPEKEQQQLEQDLKENISLRQQFNAYKQTILSPETTLVFSEKLSLLKPAVHEEHLLAYIENELKGEEKKRIENILQVNKTVQTETDLYRNTFLAPDLAITYPNKKELKRGAKVLYLSVALRYGAIAASLLLLVGLFLLFNNNSSTGTQVAKNDAPNPELSKQPLNPVHKNNAQVNSNNAENGTTSTASVKNTSQVKISPSDLSHQQDANTLANNRDTAVKPNPLADVAVLKDSAQSPEHSFAGNNPVARVDNPYKAHHAEEDEAPRKPDNTLTPLQYVTQHIQTTTWGEKEKNTEQKKLSGFDVLAYVAKKLKGMGNKNTDAKTEYNEDRDATEYTLTLGQLSITRTKRN